MSSDRLRKAVPFSLLAGQTQSLLHHLVLEGRPLVPDQIEVAPTIAGVEVDADETHVVATNRSANAVSFVALCYFWHPIKRLLGADSYILPRPFVTGTLDLADGNPTTFSAINGESTTLLAGTVVCNPVDRLLRASSTGGMARGAVRGLVIADADPTLNAQVLPEGALTLTAIQWAAVLEEPGLIPGADYYLAADPGKLTTSPTAIPGRVLSGIGSALTDLTLLVRVGIPVLL